MQNFEKLVLDASRHLRLADHLTFVTYPMLKDAKLLLSILDNLDKTFKAGLDAFLYYELLYKRISSFPQDLKSKLDLFQRTSAMRYGLNEYPIIIREIDFLLKKHKESPVEFVKDGRLVICSDSYRLKVIQIEDLKKYLLKAKTFILRLSNINS